MAVTLAPLLLVIAACDFGPFAPISLPPMKLAMSFQQDSSIKYKFHLHSEGTTETGGSSVPVKADMTATETINVRSVHPDGTADLDMELDSSKLTVNDVEIELPQSNISSHLTVSRDGRILDGGPTSPSSSGSPSLPPGLDQFTPVLTDQEVKAGDTWSKTFDRPVPFGEGTLHFVTTNKLLRYDPVGSVDAAVIDTTSEMPMNFSLDVRKLLAAGNLADVLRQLPAKSQPKIGYSGSGNLHLVSTLDPNAGQLLKAHMDGKFDVKLTFVDFPKGSVSQGPVPVSGKVTLDLERVS